MQVERKWTTLKRLARERYLTYSAKSAFAHQTEEKLHFPVFRILLIRKVTLITVGCL